MVVLVVAMATMAGSNAKMLPRDKHSWTLENFGLLGVAGEGVLTSWPHTGDNSHSPQVQRRSHWAAAAAAGAARAASVDFRT